MSIYEAGDTVTSVKGVGDITAEKLHKLGIYTVSDLLNHYPRNYIDFTKQVKIKQLKEKEPASFLAVINTPKSFFSGSGKLITQATATDQTGKITLTWFNNPYIKRLIQDGSEYSIAGKPSFFGPKLTIISPVIEEGNSFSLNTKGLVPVYPQTAGVTSKWLRKEIFEVLKQAEITDPLDVDLLTKNKLMNLYESLSSIHFPENSANRLRSDKRLAYNQHLRINLNNRLEQDKLGHSVAIKSNTQVDAEIKKKLPFTLTESQEKVIAQMYKDLHKPEFTHRLIQGETGSGKTALLLFAAGQCLNAGQSCAIMAPTEILANQHFHTFKKLFLFPGNLKLVTSGSHINTSSLPTVFIGTHALLNQLDQATKPPLAFIAIDEQHKFGVNQREVLLKRRPIPHLFNLSATPIPRTVALGLLGDIEISSLSHKPENRLPVKTFIVSPTKFKDSPKWLITKLSEKNQIFVVCPSIDDREQAISSVEREAKNYRRIIPGKFPILSIHGRMKPDEQKEVIAKFKDQHGGILIATSLIEVGIDIPTANIMIIHSAERFGLAQLHQLRGRVGRGGGQGYCFLVPSIDDEVEKERLQLLQKHDSGLVLAQKDLRLRGAGEVFGEKQHGSLQTRLKHFWSKKLFLTAKKDAIQIVREDKEKAKEIASRLLSW